MSVVKGSMIYHQRPPLAANILGLSCLLIFTIVLIVMGIVGLYEKDWGLLGVAAICFPGVLYMTVHSLFRGVRCDSEAIYVTGEFRTQQTRWEDIERFGIAPSRDIRPVQELTMELKNGTIKQVTSIMSVFRVNDYLRDTCTDLEALRQTHVDGLDKQE